MMLKIQCWILCLGFLWISFSPLQAQQVWTKKKGELYTHLGTSFSAYSSVFNADGPAVLLPRFVTDITIDNYTEYGLFDNLMLTVHLPFRVAHTSSNLNPDAQLPLVAGGDSLAIPAATLANLGNIRLGFTYGIMQDKAFRMAFKLNTTLKTAAYDETTGLRTGPSAWGICPLILVGYGQPRFFASTELGYNFRSNGYSGQLISNSQIGTRIKEHYYIIIMLSLLTPINPTDYDEETAGRRRLYQTGLFHNNQQYLSPGVKFGCDLNPNWSLWAGIGLGGGIADEVGQTPGISLAIAYQLKN